MDDGKALLTKLFNSNPKYDYSEFLAQENPDLSNLIINRTLTGKGRNIVIELIKKPIEMALVNSIRLFIKMFGRVTKENSILKTTHILIDKKAKFFEHYIGGRRLLLDSGWELLLFENEHDNGHYGWMLHWLVSEIAEEMKNGNWPELPEKFPQKDCWID